LPHDKERKLNDESTTNSIDLIVEGVSNDLSPRDHLQQCNLLANYAVRCQRHAEVRKGCNKKGADSLTVNTDMVLETALKSSPYDKGRKLNDERTVSSAEFSVERGSNNLRTTKRNNSNHILRSRRECYALRTRDPLGKIGINDTSVSDDSPGRRKSEQSDANSSIVDMNVSIIHNEYD